MHCLLSARFLVTIHDEPCRALQEAAGGQPHAHEPPPTAAGALHRVVHPLVQSLLPLISDLDARGDELADAVLEDSVSDVQRQLLETRRRVIALRRVAMPQRDVIGRLSEADEEDVHAMTRAVSRRFRGDYERMVRVVDALDGARDAAQAATDVYLGTVNNRLNVRKAAHRGRGDLPPLEFPHGLLRSELRWRLDYVGSAWAFVLLGLALPVLTVLGLWELFRRRRWL